MTNKESKSCCKAKGRKKANANKTAICNTDK
jgi:hypothetical protein